MISKEIEKAINNQIKLEEHSARIYMSMASWCEINGYAGAAGYLYAHSDEERTHMLKLVHFLNDRGGQAILDLLEKPNMDYNSLDEVFESVLKHERFVTKSINDLVDICITEKDHTTNGFLQWFVNEQIEEESQAQAIVDKIKLIGPSKGGYYHLDMYLDNLAAGDINAGE